MKTAHKSNQNDFNKLQAKLTRIRESLSYDEDKDDVLKRMAAIEQMKAIGAYLHSKGIEPYQTSPFYDVIRALELLSEGRESALFERKKTKVSLSVKSEHARASAALVFLASKKKIGKKVAATKIINMMMKYNIPLPRQKSSNPSGRKNRREGKIIPHSNSLLEWSRQVRNGKKGESAQRTYFRELEAFEARSKPLPKNDKYYREDRAQFSFEDFVDEYFSMLHHLKPKRSTGKK